MDLIVILLLILVMFATCWAIWQGFQQAKIQADAHYRVRQLFNATYNGRPEHELLALNMVYVKIGSSKAPKEELKAFKALTKEVLEPQDTALFKVLRVAKPSV